MREGILGIEKEAYFSSYSNSPREGQKYTVYCDASRDGLGCVFMQPWRVVAYGSSVVKESQAELPHA